MAYFIGNLMDRFWFSYEANEAMNQKETFWSPLDNVAKIFTVIRNKEHTAAMRLSPVITEPIAINIIILL